MRRSFTRTLPIVLLAGAAWGAGGCSMLNGFLDPTRLGSFPTDVKEAGLRRVLTPHDVPLGPANAEPPTAADLVAAYEDYRIGPGDQVAVIVQDLLGAGAPYQAVHEVSATGYIRLPLLGSVKANGLTEQELEEELRSQISAADIIPSPLVQVFMQVRQNQVFSILGQTAVPGFYPITRPDMRLLDAIGLARDIGSQVPKLYVIRRETTRAQEPGLGPPPADTAQPVPSREGLLIPPPGAQGQYAAFSGMQSGDDRAAMNDALAPSTQTQSSTQPDSRFPVIIFDPQTGEPVEMPVAPPAEPAPVPQPVPTAQQEFSWDEVPEYELSQRVIEIDVNALRAGDPRQNIVIRDRDVINVPVDTGVFYMMGEVNRPGVYAFSGREITLKQAVALVAGLSPFAWPQRCEIIRRAPGSDKETTIPVNLDAIFAGLEDDVLLRDNDIVNVGTHVVAPFLFVIRNSFRFTYGFGFVYDRNFADQDAYNPRTNPETLDQIRRQNRGLPF